MNETAYLVGFLLAVAPFLLLLCMIVQVKRHKENEEYREPSLGELVVAVCYALAVDLIEEMWHRCKLLLHRRNHGNG